MINGEKVDALALIVHRDRASPERPGADREDERADPAADVRRGDPGGHRRPDHRPTTVKALRKKLARESATAVTSAVRRSCWEKQKAGKKRMKQVGSVEIPQEAFLAVLQGG